MTMPFDRCETTIIIEEQLYWQPFYTFREAVISHFTACSDTSLDHTINCFSSAFDHQPIAGGRRSSSLGAVYERSIIGTRGDTPWFKECCRALASDDERLCHAQALPRRLP